jgi:hypothetical protein
MRRAFIPFVFLTLALFTISCSTSRSASRFGKASRGYTTLSKGNVAITFGYVDERDLFRLYGQNNNPFIRYKSGRLIVLEVAIQSDESLFLYLDKAQLRTPGGIRGNTTKQEVYNYYYGRLITTYGGYSRHYSPHPSTTLSHPAPESEPYISHYGYAGRNKNSLNNWSLKYTTQIIDETILPQDLYVERGKETVGYILFEQVRGEKKVDATFTLPVYVSEDELLHEFVYTFPV